MWVMVGITHAEDISGEYQSMRANSVMYEE